MILLEEKVDKGFSQNQKEHKELHDELKELILRGDAGAAELITEEETQRETIEKRVTILEKDVTKIKQRLQPNLA